MIAAIDRAFVSQVVIVLAVCIGGWMMLIEPRAQELADLTALAEDAAQAEVAGSTANTVKLSNRLLQLRERVREVSTANALAQDSSTLYDRIMKLAQKHGVRVTSLTPGASPQSQRDGKVVVSRVDVAVEGTYAATAEFTEAMRTMGGFVRPSTLSVSPRQVDGRNLVSARLTCEVLQFPLPETLLTLEGVAGNDA